MHEHLSTPPSEAVSVPLKKKPATQPASYPELFAPSATQNAVIRRGPGVPTQETAQLLGLQRRYGNRYVQRMLAATGLMRQDDDGSSSSLGIFPDSRPADYAFSVDSNDQTFDTSRFSVDNGRVTVTSVANWNPPSSGAPQDYSITLQKWGLLGDTPISANAFRVSVSDSATWRGLDSGSYYLRVSTRVNLDNIDAALSGTAHVT